MATFLKSDDPRWDTVLNDRSFGDEIEGFHRIPRIYRWSYVVRGKFFNVAVEHFHDWIEDPSRPGEVYMEHQPGKGPAGTAGMRHMETWLFFTDPNVAFEFTMAWT